METFAERLEQLLKENNLTQARLADIVQIRRLTISDWKRQGTFPPADVAVKIAKTLHTSVEYLVTGESLDTTNSELIALSNRIDTMKKLASQIISS